MDINRFQNFLQLLDDACAKLTYNGSSASHKIKSMGLSDGDTSISESQFISWIQRNSDAGYDEAKKLSARAEINLKNINNMIINGFGSFIGGMFEENVNEAYDILSGYSKADSIEEKRKQLINILGIPSMFLNSGSDIGLFMRIKWILEHTPFFVSIHAMAIFCQSSHSDIMSIICTLNFTLKILHTECFVCATAYFYYSQAAVTL